MVWSTRVHPTLRISTFQKFNLPLDSGQSQLHISQLHNCYTNGIQFFLVVSYIWTTKPYLVLICSRSFLITSVLCLSGFNCSQVFFYGKIKSVIQYLRTAANTNDCLVCYSMVAMCANTRHTIPETSSVPCPIASVDQSNTEAEEEVVPRLQYPTFSWYFES